MKIILSECISERLFFELLAKMSSYKIDRVFVYHKGNRTRDKRNTFPPAAMVCREMNKANKAKYLKLFDGSEVWIAAHLYNWRAYLVQEEQCDEVKLNAYCKHHSLAVLKLPRFQAVWAFVHRFCRMYCKLVIGQLSRQFLAHIIFDFSTNPEVNYSISNVFVLGSFTQPLEHFRWTILV